MSDPSLPVLLEAEYVAKSTCLTATIARVAGVSRVGRSHVEAGETCQDWHGAAEVKGLLILCVADGAGSASHGEAGAKAAVRGMLEADWTDPVAQSSPGRLLRRIVVAMGRAAGNLRKLALEAGLEPKSHATTLLVVASTVEFVVAVQIGDGLAAVQRADSGFEPLLRPRGGEHANETTFLTSRGALDRRSEAVHVGPWTGVALQTDGLQWVTYHAGEERLYAPFYQAFASHIEKSADPNESAEFIATALDSAPIQARCTDDLTLLVAVRHEELTAA